MKIWLIIKGTITVIFFFSLYAGYMFIQVFHSPDLWLYNWIQDFDPKLALSWVWRNGENL